MSTDTSTSAEPAATTTEADDLNHIVCCDDDNLAMCGLDLTEVEWMARGALPDCPTCERLWEKDEDCYAGECPHCPRNVLKGLS